MGGSKGDGDRLGERCQEKDSREVDQSQRCRGHGVRIQSQNFRESFITLAYVSPIAPLAAGAGATVSNSAEDMLLAVPSTSADQRASEARLEEPSIHDQSDILSASRSAEVSGMKRKRAQDEVEQDENPRKGGPRKERPKCRHGKHKRYCKECGGSAISSHGKNQRFCKECGGSSICSHGKRKAQCKECGGSAICGHGKQKAQCKECGGSSICSHGKLKAKPCLGRHLIR